MDVKKDEKNEISSRDVALINKLSEFYKDESNLQKLLLIVKGQSAISLRILDWFVTNYAKKKVIIYDLNEDEYVIVYNDYKSQLNSYYKKQFDPFCRHERICFYYDDDNHIVTTIGQLNFFRWAIEKDIIGYVEKNLDDIENDMNTTSSKLYPKTKKKKERKKRSVISKSANCLVNRTVRSVVVSFD